MIFTPNLPAKSSQSHLQLRFTPIPHPPPYSPQLWISLSLSFLSNSRISICDSHILWCGVIYRSAVTLPRATPLLKQTGSPPLEAISCFEHSVRGWGSWVPRTPCWMLHWLGRVQVAVDCVQAMVVCRPWSCVGLMQAAIGAVNLWLQQSCWVQKAVFCFGCPWLLAFPIWHIPLPKWFSSPEIKGSHLWLNTRMLLVHYPLASCGFLH